MKRVVVAGAGLAGLTVARLLAERGVQVVLLDAAGRTGGKAGADEQQGIPREHGYHIFPAWYANVRAQLSELGVKLIDLNSWHYLKDGARDQLITVPVPRSVATLVQALRAGLFSWYDGILYGYFTVDALAESMSHAAVLDEVSRIGMMRSRWYMTEVLPEFEQENLLKASAIPACDMSAMTVKRVISLWARSPHPFLSILPGDLQSTYIAPFQAKVVAAGAELRLNTAVTGFEVRDGRITALKTFGAGDGRVEGDAFVVATPLEVTRKLLGGEVFALDPELGSFENLDAAPMAALYIDLNRRLPWTPAEHVVMHGGRYGLSFIDLARHWPGMPNSSLAFIASNFSVLRDLSPSEQLAELMGEVRRYMNLPVDAIVRTTLKPNLDTPLFINTVGAWPNRPASRSEKVSNLYFAGDWVRNGIDLACMEGTVWSALETGAAVAKALGAPSVPPPLEPASYPEAMFRVLKWLLLPLVPPVWAYAQLQQKLRRGAVT